MLVSLRKNAQPFDSAVESGIQVKSDVSLVQAAQYDSRSDSIGAYGNMDDDDDDYNDDLYTSICQAMARPEAVLFIVMAFIMGAAAGCVDCALFLRIEDLKGEQLLMSLTLTVRQIWYKICYKICCFSLYSQYIVSTGDCLLASLNN